MMARFIIIFFGLAILSPQSSAQPALLLPTPNISWRIYQQNCLRSGLICIHQFFEEIRQVTPTPQFDRLIDQFDLHQYRHKTDLLQTIRHILRTEPLSTDQLDMLLALTESESRVPQMPAQRALRKELRQVQNILSQFSINSPAEEYFIFFNTPLSVRAKSALERLGMSFPVYYFHFSQLPQVKTTREISKIRKKYLFTQLSDCSYKANFTLRSHWLILKKKFCGISQKVSKKTRERFVLSKEAVDL